jgi:hypothetical protein
MLVILALRRQRQEDLEFEVRLGNIVSSGKAYTVRLCFKENT